MYLIIYSVCQINHFREVDFFENTTVARTQSDGVVLGYEWEDCLLVVRAITDSLDTPPVYWRHGER